MTVYLFGWPGTIGGASTKFAHLIWLLHRRYPITVVALEARQLHDEWWRRWLDKNQIAYCRMDDLPTRLRGWGVSLCNSEFVGSARWVEMRRRGLKMAWGNEMTWILPGEAGAIVLGQIDALLYVSPAQRAALEPQYRRLLRGSLHADAVPIEPRATTGWINGNSPRDRLRWIMVGNYISPAAFPFRPRPARRSGLIVGRLSRPDPSKFPNDFPASYEALGLKGARFKVMAWNEQLEDRWSSHAFDDRWELLHASPDPAGFLQSLDLFVYEPGPNCRESWGRVVVEAMLTGAIPLVPRGGGHHLENLIAHGKSGFVCRHRDDFARYARYLQDCTSARLRISRQGRDRAVARLCDRRSHLRAWDEVFQGC
jgi:hypothetical protein